MSFTGINVHMSYGGTNYDNTTAIANELADLNQDWVRDQLLTTTETAGWYTALFDEWRSLNTIAGVQLICIVGQPVQGGNASQQDAVISFLLDKLSPLATEGVLGAIEGPNEWDTFGGYSGWWTDLRLYTQRLHALTRAHSNPAVQALTIVGPALAGINSTKAANVGDLSSWVDKGAIHFYVLPTTSGSSMVSTFDHAEVMYPGRPIWVTETGCNTNDWTEAEQDQMYDASVPSFRHLGAERIFYYELIDLNASPVNDNNRFGALRSDFSWKPVAYSIQEWGAAVEELPPDASGVWFGTDNAEIWTMNAGTSQPTPLSSVWFGTADGQLWNMEGPATLPDPEEVPDPNPLTLRLEIDSAVAPKAWGMVAGWTRITHGDVSPSRNGILSLRIERGQRERYGPCEPGEMLVTIDNRNGHLDSENAGSPYFGKLTQGRQVRLVHTRNDTGLDQVVFAGKIDDIQAVDGDLFPVVQIVVSDAIALAGTTMLPPSYIEYQLTDPASTPNYPKPTSVWPLSEEVTAPDVRFADVVGGYDAIATGSPPAAAGSNLVPYTDNQGLVVKGINSRLGASLAAFPENPPWSVMFVCRVEDENSALFFYLNDAILNAIGLRVRFDAGRGGIVAEAEIKEGATRRVVTGTLHLSDAVPHMIAMSDSAAQLNLYVDGAGQGGLGHSVVTAPTDSVKFGFGENASIALVCIWDELLTVGANHWPWIWTDLRAPLFNQSVYARINSLLDIALPGVVRSLSANSTICLPVTMGVPLLDLLRRLVGPFGRLWSDRANVLRYDPLATSSSSAIRTYGDAIPVTNPQRAKGQPVTHVTVENEAGSKAQYHDRAASERLGEQRLPINGSPLKHPTDLKWMATQVVAERSADTASYTASFDLDASLPTVGYDDTLALELYEKVDHVLHRRWMADVTESLQVIGLVHEAENIGQDGIRWTTAVRTRPA